MDRIRRAFKRAGLAPLMLGRFVCECLEFLHSLGMNSTCHEDGQVVTSLVFVCDMDSKRLC